MAYQLLTIIISGLLIGVCACSQTENAPLSIQTYTAAAPAAMANSHLIVGKREAILVDVVMTRSEAVKLADMVKQSGRALKMIFITHAHPDHYLGLDVLSERFPEARIVATDSVVAGIQKNGPGLVERLRARLGENGPARLIVPEPVAADELDLEGTKIKVIAFNEGESEHAAALYISRTHDFIAGDLIYHHTHLFLREKRIAGWLKQLDRIAEIDGIKTIYPGHGPQTDLSALTSMRAYLHDFSEAIRLGSAEAATQKMLEKYPDYAMPIFLRDYSLPSFFPATESNVR